MTTANNMNVTTLFRCAIYARKSSEHNLDLAFTSLDAQREACEAYIKSQTAEGWRLVAKRPAGSEDLPRGATICHQRNMG